MRRLLREPVIIQENVPEFNWHMLCEIFEDMYIVVSTCVDPATLGWPVQRERRITIMMDRRVVNHILIDWCLFSNAIRRVCNISWVAFMVAGHDILQREKEWAATLPTCVSNVVTMCSLSQQHRTVACESEWTKLLSSESVDFLCGYRMRFQKANKIMACNLSQDPVEHPTYSVAEEPLPTLICNSPMLWAEVSNTDQASSSNVSRWFASLEMMVAQGFPALPNIGLHGESQWFPLNAECLLITFKAKRHHMFSLFVVFGQGVFLQSESCSNQAFTSASGR